MSFATYAAAKASLREFCPAMRARHTLVKFWSTTHGAYRYCRVLGKVA